MALGFHNIEVEQGVTYGLDLTFKNGDGTIRDLTAYAARLMFRTHLEANTPQDIWNNGEEITLSSTAPNLRITASASKTSSYPVGTYEYDLEVELSGVVEKVLAGKLRVIGEVSK